MAVSFITLIARRAAELAGLSEADGNAVPDIAMFAVREVLSLARMRLINCGYDCEGRCAKEIDRLLQDISAVDDVSETPSL